MATTFSYAQAAKGIATPTPANKPASGAATPAKDAATTPGPAPLSSVKSWADDEDHEPLPTTAAASHESRPQRSSSKPARRVSHSVDGSSVSSPDLGASSSSTVTKDDDVSSLPNASSESTWDNKSQASTSVDKSVEPVEKTSDKVKKGKNAVIKPLQEAPLPAVNIWKLRADEQKAKVQKAAPFPVVNGVPQSQSAIPPKKESGTRERPATSHSRSKSRDAASKSRSDAKSENDTKKGVKGKFFEKDVRSTPSVLPPPPNRDQEAWPTPETAIDEDRKKAQEKGEKVEKERKDGSGSNAAHGKHEWVKVPYTPSVVFNTPLPNAANARRGGRPGGRGGAQSSGRPNGAGQPEKDSPAPDVAMNGEQTKRERLEGAAPRDGSPKSKLTNVMGSPTSKAPIPAPTGETLANHTGPTASEADAHPRRASMSQMPSQGGTYPPRGQYPGRSGKGRRGDFSSTGERRREDPMSPIKDHVSDDRRNSAATQTDATADGERRASTFPDGPNGHHSKHGRFSSHTGGRERGRGGGRSARASYSNGHQFSNGQLPPMQSSASFPSGPRSPTSFNSENSTFFTAPQGKYGRNGHRAQSVTTDSYRYQPFPNGAPVPPLQTTYNMYDYSMAQPMSAVPYSPYLEQYQLFSMITTQVEYYFSVDNLCKDMYLRRHMDSQGFVSLQFIAGFNRIKQLSTDVELIKLVCQQSNVIEYRTSEDGLDRLRRKEDWSKWVLNIAERDESAQNEGPKELHRPPVAHPMGFDQSNPPQWPMLATTGYGNDGIYPLMNGYHGATQDPAGAGSGILPNGSGEEGLNGTAAVNGHAPENPTA